MVYLKVRKLLKRIIVCALLILVHVKEKDGRKFLKRIFVGALLILVHVKNKDRRKLL